MVGALPHLRSAGRLYGNAKGSHDRRGQLRNRYLSASVPSEAATVTESDWEGDTVHGKGSNLVTLVVHIPATQYRDGHFLLQ